jgi:asparagine synthase (glutamine-hydrolysing)
MAPRLLRKAVFEPMLRVLPDSFNHPVWERVRRAKRFISGVAERQPERHYRWMQILTEEAKAELVRGYQSISDRYPLWQIEELYEEFSSGPINAMLFVDVMFVLPYNMLFKADSMSMLNSLEIRVPYLDRAVVESAFSLSEDLKLKGTKRKFILVEAFRDILPKRLHHRPKQGFDVPIGEWFKDELKDQFWSVMNKSSLNKTGVLNYAPIKRMYDLHATGNRDFSKQLLNLFILQWWLLREAITG